MYIRTINFSKLLALNSSGTTLLQTDEDVKMFFKFLLQVWLRTYQTQAA